MQISINVWLETNVIIVTANLKYMLPGGCSKLELTGGELLYLEKVNLNKQPINTYKLSDYNKKLTITELPENGELTMVTHSPIFSFNEENVFYYADLKSLIYAGNNQQTTFKLHSIYNNADQKKFPTCLFTEYFYIFAGNFNKITINHLSKTIRIYFLQNQIEKAIFLLQTIKKLMHVTAKQNLPTIAIVSDQQSLANNCEYIINSDYLPQSIKTNTNADYKHAFKIIAEKYLTWQNIKQNDKIIQKLLELEYGTYETQIDYLHNQNTLPADIPNIINKPLERWIVTQKIFETLIINLAADPYTNINDTRYAAKIRELENSFILTAHDKNMHLGLKARLFTMPSQAKILASNTSLSISIRNLKQAYDKLEMFLAVNFKKTWINQYYQNDNTELAFICLKYLAKLGNIGTGLNYFTFGTMEEKLNILYILCVNYNHQNSDIRYYVPGENNLVRLYSLLNNIQNLCKNLTSLSIFNFYYNIFSNNLHILHNENGKGYAVLSKIIISLDQTEHHLAIKLLSLFTSWPHMDMCRYKLAEKYLIDLSLNLNTSQSLSIAINNTISSIKNIKPDIYSNLILYPSFQEKQRVSPSKAVDPRIKLLKLTNI